MDSTTPLTAPASAPSTSAPTPTTPIIATTEQVSAHQTIVETAIADLEKAPQTVENATKYLDLKAEAALEWVQQKHVRTRIIEAVLLAGAVAFALGFALGKIF